MKKIPNLIVGFTGYTLYVAENLKEYIYQFPNLEQGKNGLCILINGQYYLETENIEEELNKKLVDVKNLTDKLPEQKELDENTIQNLKKAIGTLTQVVSNLTLPQYNLRNAFQSEYLPLKVTLSTLKKQNQYSKEGYPDKINPIFSPLISYNRELETHILQSWQNVPKKRKNKQRLTEIIGAIPQTN